MRFLQDYPKGKRGEWECKNCGMRGLYSCLNATKSHLSGSGCDGVRILFGLKGGEKLNDGKTRSILVVKK